MRLEQWRSAIDLASDRAAPGAPSKDDIVAIARELFPLDMAHADVRATRQGQIKALNDAMRSLTDVEETGDGPTQPDLFLPGKPAQVYVTVPDPAGGNSISRYRKIGRKLREAAIKVREVVRDRVTETVRDLWAKEAFLAEAGAGDDSIEAFEARRRRDAAEVAAESDAAD